MTTDVLSRNAVLTENKALIVWAGRRASRMTGGRLAVEDAVSEVALLAIRKFDQWDPARFRLSTFLKWVAWAVAGRHQQYIRRECRDVDRERSNYHFDRLAVRNHRDEFDGDLAKYLGDRLTAAVAALPPGQRKAVTLRFGLDGEGERPLRDIDSATTRENNRQQVHNGLRNLRAILTGRRPVVGGKLVKTSGRSVA